MANNVVAMKVKPKEEVRTYEKQKYVLKFDPNAPPSERWCWVLHFTVVYPYIGSAATLQAADAAVKRKIRSLLHDNERWNK